MQVKQNSRFLSGKYHSEPDMPVIVGAFNHRKVGINVADHH